MKKVFSVWLCAAACILLLFGCSVKQSAVSGKAADVSVDFSKIAQYAWVSEIDKIPQHRLFVGPNGLLIYNNESSRNMIKNAIQYELDSRGYKMDVGAADMFVSFAVMEQPGSLRTTNGYVELSSGERVHTEDNVTYTDVKAGTLIINFMDADTKEVIWQGFASGILHPDQVKDESKVRQAVSQVFSEFSHSRV